MQTIVCYSVWECEGLVKAINDYSCASGQRINFEKSNIRFSSNAKVEDPVLFCQRLGVVEVQELSKYLGMPSHVGRCRVAAFSIIKDRLWARLNSWATQLLSKAGQEILIRAVAQAIPTFLMSCFKIPLCLIDDMNAMISRSWWGKTGGGKGIHWTKWMDMCTSKLQGGSRTLIALMMLF